MEGRPPSAVQRGEAPQPTMLMFTTPTKTKTKVQPGSAAFRQAARKPLLPPSPTTPSRTSPSSSPAAARNLPSQKLLSKNLPASVDSAPASAFAIPNMEKELFTSAKEKAKKLRLLYNFLASA